MKMLTLFWKRVQRCPLLIIQIYSFSHWSMWLGQAHCIVMPFMTRGSLLTYLKKERQNLAIAETSHDFISFEVLYIYISSLCPIYRRTGNRRD